MIDVRELSASVFRDGPVGFAGFIGVPESPHHQLIDHRTTTLMSWMLSIHDSHDNTSKEVTATENRPIKKASELKLEKSPANGGGGPCETSAECD
jgi:hypothetical protein